jgi:hypothetical protein
LARLVRTVHVCAEQMRERGAHAKDQDRQAGHGGGNAPRSMDSPNLRKEVVRNLASHA